MPEDKKEKNKEEPKVLVVKELPVTQLRVVNSQDGKETYGCLTVEEALTEIIEKIRNIEKKL